MTKTNKETFINLLINNTYLTWLSNFMERKKSIDDLNFIHKYEISDEDIIMIEYLKYLYDELCSLQNINAKVLYDELYNCSKNKDLPFICLKYQNLYYVISHSKECYSCKHYDKPVYLSSDRTSYTQIPLTDEIIELPYIEYEELLAQYSLKTKAEVLNINIISLDDLLKKIFASPDELYKKICDALDDEERQFIIKNIQNKSCTNCEKLECPKKDNNIPCQNWINKEKIGKIKILKLAEK